MTTPTAMKALAGFPGHRPKPDVDAEPQPPGDLAVDSAPKSLSAAAKAHWRYAIENAPAYLLRLADQDVLAMWACAVAEMYLAEAELAKCGQVQMKDTIVETRTLKDGTVVEKKYLGYEMESKWVRVRERAVNRMITATKQLGFSPTSRSRIRLEQATAPQGRFANNAAAARRS